MRETPPLAPITLVTYANERFFLCVGRRVRGAKALFNGCKRAERLSSLLVPLLTGPASHCAGPKIAARGLCMSTVCDWRLPLELRAIIIQERGDGQV
jgi:hypothetical protein